MALKFKATVDTPKWLEMIRAKQRPVAEAAVGALRDVAAMSVQEGRADIAAAGNFKGGWISGLQYLTKDAKDEGGGPSLQAKAIIFHRIGLAGVFESGGTINGRPLLWIPTTHGAPSPKKLGRKLTFATVNGTPLAFAAADKDRHRKPLYIGVPQVTIPKKFHIIEIVKANVKKIAAAFLLRFKDN
jgi:hypothetical protein